MYTFHDLEIDRRIPTKEERPIEALNYAGHWLDDEIPGYMTLNTSGRNEFSRQINTSTRVGDGETYLSSRLESKKIDVTFQLLANTIEQYNERLKKLKALLFKPDQPFYFEDLPDYHFVGSVTELSLDSDTLNTTGKIEITLTDPYLHGKQKTISTTGNKVTINDNDLLYEQTPDKLSFTPSKAVANLTVTCNDKTIKLSVGVNQGQKVVIDFNALNLSINAVDNLMGLDLSSNLGDFYIVNGATIDFNATGKIELVYEVKQL